MAIEDKDLLQANVTIIAGVLVLLTLVTLIAPQIQLLYKGYVAAAIAPFAASSIFLIHNNKLASEKKQIVNLRMCQYMTIVGFFTLLTTLLFIQYN